MRSLQIRRKSHMTLLETLIAVSLLAVLLTFAFGFFRELSEITRLTEKSQKESFQMRYLESRLGFIFARVVNENEKNKRDFFFYTEGPQSSSSSPSLVLTFNNEARLDPTFSGDVLGKIYLNKDHSLRLAIWPLRIKDPQEYLQEEILIEGVESLRFSFYSPPEQISSKKDLDTQNTIDPEKKSPEKNMWHQGEWAMSYEQMPGIVKLEITLLKEEKDPKKEENEPISFYFVLPSSKNPVQYPPN